MRRADRVIDGAWRALRPGGRFVAEFGGAGCVATIAGAYVFRPLSIWIVSAIVGSLISIF